MDRLRTFFLFTLLVCFAALVVYIQKIFVGTARACSFRCRRHALSTGRDPSDVGDGRHLTNITSRSTDTKEEMAKQLTQRLTALGRAHELVRPLPDGQGNAALLGDLFTVLLAPYDDVGAFAGRIRVAVPRMELREKAATGLALVIHELAKNSLKYGALSSDTGLLGISAKLAEDNIEIVWSEQGGNGAKAPKSQ